MKADLVIGDFASLPEEFLVVAAEYLLALLDRKSDLSSYELTSRGREKVERTMGFLRDSQHVSVRAAMARMDGGTGAVWLPRDEPSSAEEEEEEVGDRRAGGLGDEAPYSLAGSGRLSESITAEDRDLSERLRRLKAALRGEKAEHSVASTSTSTPSRVDTGAEDTSSSSDESSDTEAEAEAPSEGEGEQRAEEGGRDDGGGHREEVTAQEDEEVVVVPLDSPSPSSSSSSGSDSDSDYSEGSRPATCPAAVQLHVKRGAVLHKFFSSWMAVVQTELFRRQRSRTLRRLFVRNQKVRRAKSSLRGWMLVAKQKKILGLCVTKWPGIRLHQVFDAWRVVARKRHRNNRLACRSHSRRLRYFLLWCFRVWRAQLGERVYGEYGDLRARVMLLEEEQQELLGQEREARGYRDHLYSVLAQVAEIGVNLLRVENGGEALIECCQKVETILKLNSAYVPQEALDAAMANIDFGAAATPHSATPKGQSNATAGNGAGGGTLINQIKNFLVQSIN